MQTYGQKWRANSASCATAHVPRSFQPLLRLDSTGDVSSVECRCPTSNAQLSVQPTDMNHNPCAMKNWVTNRVLGWSTLSGSQRKMGADMNANMFEYVSGDIMNGTLSSNMYPRDQKVMQPQCGLTGWNYNGRNYVRPVFPCHQYINSFNNKCHNGLFSHSDFMRLNGTVCPSVKVVDQRRQKCPKSDRSRRGHSPRHQKPQHTKQEKSAAAAPKQESSKTNKSEKSSPPSDCDSNDLTTGTEPEKMPVKHASKSTLTHRILDDLRNMGFDIVSQNQGMPDGVGSSVLDNQVNKNSDSCEQRKLSELNGNSNSSVRQTKETCERKSDIVAEVKSVDSKTCDSAPNEVTDTSETDNSSSQDTNFHVLFIRKNWKKGRPSASKQRRRKMQKAKSAMETAETDANTDFQDGVCGNSEVGGEKSKSMSFIVGFNQIPSPNLPSNTANFTFSFSEDEDDDDSSDDWDSDMNFGHIEAEFSQCDLFNFLPGCNTPSKPINVKVHIKPVEIGADNDQECIERLNKAWGIQLSVENDLTVIKKTKQSAKKVHFPEDEDLHVVHHMFTWSYAYRSARKCYWENFARDRERFKRRVQEIEHVLLPVLDRKHRESVYQRLYKSDVLDTSTV